MISPILANMTLDGLERRLRERFPKTTMKGIAAKVNLVRYADDFIITAATKELLEQEVKPSGGSLHEGTRVRTFRGKNLHHAY
jgi:RNA-directed DNA polymerase